MLSPGLLHGSGYAPETILQLLLPDLRLPEDASVIAGNVLAEIAKPFTIDGNDLLVTTSIGIAIYPEDGEDEIQLSKSADCAMYQAKQHGRNRVEIYHDLMQVIGQ